MIAEGKMVTTEERRVRSRRYYAANREKVLAKVRAYYLMNIDRTLRVQRQWSARNIDKVRAYWRNYYSRNKGNRFANVAARRARQRKVTIGNRKSISKIYRRAQQWRKWGFKVAVDHMRPISKGGTHSADNLQIIYNVENRIKAAKSNYIPKIIFV